MVTDVTTEGKKSRGKKMLNQYVGLFEVITFGHI